MFFNHLKVAFRNLFKYRAFSTINIIGLAIGMTAFLLIQQYVLFERSYDDFHDRGDRIYRVAMSIFEKGEKEQTFAFTYPAVGPHLQREYGEVETAVRLRRSGSILTHEDKQYNEQVVFVDSSFFDLFSFPVLRGDPKQALSQPFQGMLSESTARKYFADKDPIGQFLETDDGHRFEVRGVFADVPENSHFKFDILFSYVTYIQIVAQYGGDAENSWGWSDFYTYILLSKGADPAGLQAKLPAFAQRYSGEAMAENNYELVYQLQPLESIHLNSDLGYEWEVNGKAQYVAFMIAIALFIMLIAWFNYINLSTARALDRAREVGIRKVVGARRAQLIRQFLLESALVNLLALGLAVLTVETVFPLFRRLTGKEITLTLYSEPAFWMMIGGLFLGGALLAGLYPAFVLSGFRPASVIKGRLSGSGPSGGLLRRGLVTLQFVATIGLVAGTLAVYRQLQFMRQQDLGIDIEQMLVLRDMARRDSTYVEQVRSFKEELERHPGIVSVAASGDVPGKEVGNSWNLRWVNSEDPSLKRARTFAIDDRFADQYGLELLAGRKFRASVPPPANEAALLVNETALRVFGLPGPKEALGEEITNHDGSLRGRIVGVVKDYHQEGLQYNFKPIVFWHTDQSFNFFSLKVETEDLAGVMSFAEEQWSARFPDTPFNSFFLDEFFDRQYQADRRFGWIFAIFTLLAILVAVLGLFGLSVYSISRRTKEIGIRRVLGASAVQILTLLSREYVRLILLAALLALPASWWGMRRWLDNYAYTIDLGIWFFLMPVITVLLIAAGTVSWQSLRAARRNPSDALRTE